MIFNKTQHVCQFLVLRAKIILRAEELQNNKAVAAELNISVQIVGKLCHRWNDLIANNLIESSLKDAKRSGAPPKITAESVCKLML